MNSSDPFKEIDSPYHTIPKDLLTPKKEISPDQLPSDDKILGAVKQPLENAPSLQNNSSNRPSLRATVLIPNNDPTEESSVAPSKINWRKIRDMVFEKIPVFKTIYEKFVGSKTMIGKEFGDLFIKGEKEAYQALADSNEAFPSVITWDKEKENCVLLVRVSSDPLKTVSYGVKNAKDLEKAKSLFKEDYKLGFNLLKKSIAITSAFQERVEKSEISPKDDHKRFFSALSDYIAPLKKLIYVGYAKNCAFEKAKSKLINFESELNDLKKKQQSKSVLDKINDIENEIKYFNLIIEDVQNKKDLAIKTKESWKKVGGEAVTITTADKVNLDGMYLSANSFRDKCKQSGASLFEIQSSTNENPLQGVSGLIFDSSNQKKDELFSVLDSLRVFPYTKDKSNEEGGGWVIVNLEKQGKTLIISDEESKKLLNSNAIKVDKNNPHQFIIEDELIADCEFESKELKPIDEADRGVVVLAEGANMIYEMQKKESLAFLLRGLDVMMVNYRGYGESEGKPTEEGTYKDIKAVYEHIRTKRSIPDEKILVKGLCLSGGIVTKLINQHPKLNFCLDQTYANLESMILQQIGIREPASKEQLSHAFYKAVEFVMKPVFSILFPDYDVKERLQSLEGKVLIITSSRDQEVPKATLHEIIESMAKKQKSHLVMAAEIPGGHATSWVEATDYIKDGEIIKKMFLSSKEKEEVETQYSGRIAMDEFLKRLDLLNPVFPSTRKKAPIL